MKVNEKWKLSSQDASFTLFIECFEIEVCANIKCPN